MVLLATLSRPPVDEVVKPTVQVVSALAAVDTRATVTPVTAWSAVMGAGVEAERSDDVRTWTVGEPVADGLVTTRITTLTMSPGFTVLAQEDVAGQAGPTGQGAAVVQIVSRWWCRSCTRRCRSRTSSPPAGSR